MVRYAGGTTAGSGERSVYKPSKNPGLGPSTASNIDDGFGDIGKGNIDLTDIPGSVGETAGNMAGLVGSLGGGVLGAIGSIGPSEDVNIGKIPEAIGAGLGAVGGIELPRARVDGIGDPNAPAATVGDIPGKMLDIVTAPGRALERTYAGQRVEGNLGALDIGAFITGGAAYAGLKAGARVDAALPPDLQARLDAGESVDVIADELVARGAGFNNDPLQNLGAQVVFDPLNFIAPGVSKAAQGVRGAGIAVQAGRNLPLPARSVGRIYNAASRGMSAAGAATMERVIGPTTSGVFFALGTKSYRTLSGRLGGLSRDYANSFQRAFDLGAAQMPRAVLARQMGEEVMMRFKSFVGRGEDGEAVIKKALDTDVEGSLAARILGTKGYQYGADELERRSQELLAEVAPDFAGMAPQQILDESAAKLAAITDMSIEDAYRVLGGSVDRRMAQTIHLAYYGKVGDDLARAKDAARLARAMRPTDAPRLGRAAEYVDSTPAAAAVDDVAEAAEGLVPVDASLGRPRPGGLGGEVIDPPPAAADTSRLDSIDIDRVTLVGPRTLTTERADELLAGLADGSITPTEAISRFDDIADHFAGKAASAEDITKFVEGLRARGGILEAIRLPRTGAHPLPDALSAWRAKYAAGGYDLAMAPKDGWAFHLTDDGDLSFIRPFVHFTSEADPVTMRNPLGRFVDSMMRGVTQTTIVLESRQRMVDAFAKRGLPVSPNQARAIHKALIEEAAHIKETPRYAAIREVVDAGTGKTEPAINGIFRRFLTDEEYRAVTAQVEPWFLVAGAFKGNLRTVGLTQFLTGSAKAAGIFPSFGKWSIAIAEHFYPNLRFRWNPLFQGQEYIESPFFNLGRGVSARELPEEARAVYEAMAEIPEMRYLTEAGYFLFLAGDKEAAKFMGQNNAIGRALARFTNIQARKGEQRIVQVFSEHGAEFKRAVESINPRYWKRMVDEYGTTDPRAIADRFITERLRVGPLESIDEAMAVLEDAAGVPIMNVETTLDGVRRAPSWADSPEGETVWQAFRDSFRRTSTQAFKTHFFSPQRGWLERTINHPYLGLYPASYMWGKVLPEFARFLLRRPFGLDAPLVGLAATLRVQQAYAAALQDDPEFAKFIVDNKDAIHLANLLVPGTPWTMPVNAPAWTRRIGQAAAKGEDITGQTITRAATDTVEYAFGPLNSWNTGVNAAADIHDTVQKNLDKAAREFDGMAGLTP